jgi:hypothetical protein
MKHLSPEMSHSNEEGLRRIWPKPNILTHAYRGFPQLPNITTVLSPSNPTDEYRLHALDTTFINNARNAYQLSSSTLFNLYVRQCILTQM